MKHCSYIFICLLATLVCACKKVSVDFTFSPSQPVAGESVSFTNFSSGGEDYSWLFGDNASSSDKNPSHVFKQSGTYIVTLRESKTKRSIQHTITVRDSVPDFSFSTDSICTFQPVLLSACVWNPYNHAVQYEWIISDNIRLLDESATNSEQITVYCTRAVEEVVRLHITKDGVTTDVEKTITVHNTPTPTLLVEDTENRQYSQHIYKGIYWEAPCALNYTKGQDLLATATTNTEVCDPIENKIYYITESGLYVKNSNETHIVLLASEQVGTVAISLTMNRLFFSTEEGVFMLPLIHTENNRYTDVPVQISKLKATKMIIDETER